ncbi:TPA: hypothetical protein IUD81_002649 [Enterococcus faecalis]|nr:hypothetical protein [Enterococcus faecalis]
MKLIYVLSGKEENKNYVKKFVGNYCSFGPKKDAKAFTSEEAEQMRKLLENSVGNAFVIDDDREVRSSGFQV